MIKQRTTDKTEVGEKKKSKGLSKSDKKGKITMFSPQNKFGDKNEENWCNKWKKKHVGQCKDDVICYKCGRPGHYVDECKYKGRVYFECTEEGHVMEDCPKKKESTR